MSNRDLNVPGAGCRWISYFKYGAVAPNGTTVFFDKKCPDMSEGVIRKYGFGMPTGTSTPYLSGRISIDGENVPAEVGADSALIGVPMGQPLEIYHELRAGCHIVVEVKNTHPSSAIMVYVLLTGWYYP